MEFRKIASLSALAFALGVAGTAPVAASDADLGPYFDRLRSAPPQTASVYRYRAAAPERRAAAPHAFRSVQPVQPAAYTTGKLDGPMLERTVFNHINIYRLSKGMRPLADHGGLASTARTHAAAMATGSAPVSHDGMRGRLMQHMGLAGRNAGGEILAYNRGAGDPARTAMHSWITSPRHKDVMEEDYNSMGVGVARRADGAYYFKVLFIR